MWGIAVAILTAVQAVGGSLTALFEKVSSDLDTAVGG
jgi:Flp pilus assembly pilin Flp